MVMLLFVPLSEMPPLVDQLVAAKSGFCCNVQPVEGDGQETVTVESCGLRAIVSSGAPGVCTAAAKAQKPPCKV